MLSLHSSALQLLKFADNKGERNPCLEIKEFSQGPTRTSVNGQNEGYFVRNHRKFTLDFTHSQRREGTIYVPT